jgi:Cu2+-exporting ATPase
VLPQANDGSFMEEPGSGAVATIGEKQVSVGTLDWIRRYKLDILFYSYVLC